MAATSNPSTDVSPTPRFLMLVDFDNTIINEDSNDTVVGVILGQQLQNKLTALKEKNDYKYMQNALAYMAERDVSEDSIRKVVEKISPTPGLPALFEYLDNHQNDFELMVVSDANVYFIEKWLEYNRIRHLFQRIFSNPASFVNGQLILQPYHSHNCTHCPENMCKQVILRKYLTKRQEQGKAPFQKVFYIGDGANDICPSRALGPDDTAFPRKDFTMHQHLKQAENVQANVVPWARGEDVVECLSKLMEES